MNRRLYTGAVLGLTAALSLSACSSSSKSSGSTQSSSSSSSSAPAAASGSSSSSTAPASATGPAPSSAPTSSAPATNLPAENINNEGTPKKGGTLNILGVGDVDYMDPNITYYSVGYLAARLWSRQLVTFPGVLGQTTNVVPDLATAPAVAASDGVTYKLTIKTGAKWDTTPARQISAADVVRGVKRTCNPAQPFTGEGDFANLIVGLADYCTAYGKLDPKSTAAQLAAFQNSHDIAGVTVDPSNPLTVVFKLTHGAAYFSSMLSLPALSPAPVEYDQYVPASAELAQHTISDGPYKITKYTPAKEIVMARNPAWDPATDTVRKAYVDDVDINETGEQEAIFQQMKADTSAADMYFDSSPSVAVVPGLIAKKDPNFYLGPTYGTSPYIVFNTVSPNNNGALTKPAVRKALSEAINRDNLTQDLNGPMVSPPLTHVLPAGISGTTSNTSPDLYKYDPAQAKKDLAAAGYPNGLTLTFLYRPKSSSSAKIYATELQDLKAAGITVKGLGVPNADFYTKYLQKDDVAKKGTWDLSLASWGPDWYGDAALSFFAPLFNGAAAFPSKGGSNYGLYDNPKTDADIKAASEEPDSAKGQALWAQADKDVMDDAVIYPITADNWPNYSPPHTHNTVFIAAMQSIDPANVWLSK